MAKEIATKTKLDTRIAADIAAAMPVANQPAAAKAVAAEVAKKAIVIDTEEVQAAVEQTVEGSADVIVAQAAGAAASSSGAAAGGMSTTALVVAGVAVAAAAGGGGGSSSSTPAAAPTTPTTPTTPTVAAFKAVTLTSSADSQDFTGAAFNGGVKVTVSGDDDAATGDDFSIKGSEANDTFIPDSFRNLIIDGKGGVDTLVMTDVDNGATVDVNLLTGVSNVNMQIRNVENVYVSSNGGRVVGNDSANTFWADEGVDDLSMGAGDDIINVDVDNFAGDTYQGGTGTDTLNITGDDTVTLTQGTDTLSSIEVVTFADKNDLAITLENYFDKDGVGANAGTTTTTATQNGITKVVLNGSAEDVLTLNSGQVNNLVGVTVQGAETIETEEDLVISSTTKFEGTTYVTALTATDDLYLNGAGTYDLSKLILTFDNVTGNTSAQTIVWGAKTNSEESIDLIDGGAGSDTITAAGTLTLDLSIGGNKAGFALANIEKLDFGSADRVLIDEADAADFYDIVGAAGDSMLIIDGNGGAVTADLSAATLAGVEQIILGDSDSGSSTLTVGTKSLSGVTSVVAGTGAGDSVKLGANSVVLSGVTFTGIETLNVDDKTITLDQASIKGFAYLEGAGGTITLSDSGALTLKDDGALAGVVNVTFASGDDTVTATFDDAGNANTWKFGAGNDTLIWNSTTDFGASTLDFGTGDDTLNIGSGLVAAETKVVNGGAGLDTVILTGTYTDVILADLSNWEIIKASGDTTTGISVTLTTGTNWNTIDLSPDTNASGTGNVVDLDGFTGKAMTVIGSAGVDTISTIGDSGTAYASYTTKVDAGAGADTINVKGALGFGNVTVTTGLGSDTVDLTDFATNGLDGTALMDSVLITDFTGGAGGDKLKLGATADGAWVEQAQVNGAVTSTSRASFSAALAAAVTAATADQAVDAASAFTYNDNTVVFYVADGSAGFDVTTDWYVVLTGLVTLSGTSNIIA